MPITTLSSGDQVCDFRTKVNELITAMNSYTSASAAKVPLGGIIDWYGDPEDPTVWDEDGIGLPDTDSSGFAQCLGQAITGATAKNPGGLVMTTTPNLQGKVTVSRSLTDADFLSIGSIGGEKEVLLQESQGPLRDHKHISSAGTTQIQYGSGSNGGSPNYGNTSATKTGTVIDVDADALLTGGQDAVDPHENMPPYVVTIKIIRYK